MSMKNVDDLLTSTNNLPTNPEVVENTEAEAPEPKKAAPTKAKEPEVEAGDPDDENIMPGEKRIRQFRKDKEAALNAENENLNEDLTENLQNTDLKSKKSELKSDSATDVDEYGTKVESTQPTQQQVQDAAKDFQPDPNSEDSWEVQLGNFVDKRLESREKQAQERAWQQKEAQRQMDFQNRFNAGIQKYPDFEQVVAGQPITNGMMMGARAFKDPAAFLYAASKTQAAELERIAALPDAFQQATEIGRLEEKMRKNKAVSTAPRPIRKVTSDVTGKEERKMTVDDKIRLDAKRKLARR
jgi:hypothetical protein